MTQDPTILIKAKTLLDSTMTMDGGVRRWYGVLHGAEQHGSLYEYLKPGLPSSFLLLNHTTKTSPF